MYYRNTKCSSCDKPDIAELSSNQNFENRVVTFKLYHKRFSHTN